MSQQLGNGLRWAAGLGLGVGLMLGAAVSTLWQPGPLTDVEIMEEARSRGLMTEREGGDTAEPEVSQGEAGRTVAFGVAPGMSFQDIADLLEAAGAIQDRDQFLARAAERNALYRAQPGIYVLTHETSGPFSDDEIIDKLVQSPS